MPKKMHSNGLGRYQTSSKKIPLEVINVLPQMRRSFYSINDLADNIYEHGIINHISVAFFTKDECLRHIKNINKVFEEHSSIRDFRTYYGYYPVLIAGERRLRAVKELHSLYPDQVKRIPATIYHHITSEDAVNLQASENTYVPPPPDEEAEFYNNYYKLLQITLGKEMSIAAFARKVGRNPTTVSKALKFCTLPEGIRKMVRDKMISYGIACELARLKEVGKTDEVIIEWALRAVLIKAKVDDFRAGLKRYLNDKQTGMFAETEFDEASGRRKVMNYEMVQAFYAQTKYMNKVIRLFDEDLLGGEESPFSLRGPFNAYKHLLELMEKSVLPHLEKIQDDPYVKRIMRRVKCVDMVDRSKKMFKKSKEFELLEK